MNGFDDALQRTVTAHKDSTDSPAQTSTTQSRLPFGWRAVFFSAAVITLLAFIAVSLYRHARLHIVSNRVEACLEARADDVEETIAELLPVQTAATPLLQAELEDLSNPPSRRLRAALALAALGDVRLEFLLQSLLNAPTSERFYILDADSMWVSAWHDRTIRPRPCEKRDFRFSRHAIALN